MPLRRRGTEPGLAAVTPRRGSDPLGRSRASLLAGTPSVPSCSSVPSVGCPPSSRPVNSFFRGWNTSGRLFWGRRAVWGTRGSFSSADRPLHAVPTLDAPPVASWLPGRADPAQVWIGGSGSSRVWQLRFRFGFSVFKPQHSISPSSRAGFAGASARLLRRAGARSVRASRPGEQSPLWWGLRGAAFPC